MMIDAERKMKGELDKKYIVDIAREIEKTNNHKKINCDHLP